MPKYDRRQSSPALYCQWYKHREPCQTLSTMRKGVRSFAVLLTALFFSLSLWAQNVTVSGRVSSTGTGENVSNVSVKVKGGTQGTTTDGAGNFTISVPSLPVTLVFTSVGFETQEVTVNSTAPVTINFAPTTIIGQEVVVSASRTPQRILEAPVTVDRVSAVAIRNAPAANYYDFIGNLRGVDVVTSSLTFKTPTTRGFSGSGNYRVNQIVDGMDNQAPGLNFSVGSVIGLTELDVESMELLTGASSALYGPGGMNGTILINSKNPFRYQGLSYQIKTGIMHIGDQERGVSPYYNWAVRWAKKTSDRFAFKIGAELIKAQDWLARDYRNYKRLGTTGQISAGTRETDPNYDGVNVYGDETTINLRTSVLDLIAQQVPFLAGYISTLPGNIPVSRTGYTENQVVNPTTINFKFSGAVHYKVTSGIEAVLAGNWGTGNTVYTGSDRYSLKDLKVGQYKLELNAKDWFLRGYTTQENAGESHNITVTTRLFNEAWKPSPTWYQQYAFAYLNALQAGRPDLEAHNIARSTADIGRPAAGSEQFRQLFDEVRKKPISAGGGLLLDKSDLYMAEGQYNFGSKIPFADVIIGGNWKQYVLNSEGTLFADKIDSAIKISEYGAYVQAGREIIKDRLRLTASGRYDKNKYFEGRFTPRVTALYKPAPDHNIRLSFQTAYRFPTTQQQWIDLKTTSGILIGGNRQLAEKYNLINNAPYSVKNFNERVPYQESKPESVTSFELGYKALIQKRLLLDIVGYYGTYQDFITRRDVIQTPTGVPPVSTTSGTGFSIVANAPGKVKTYGWALAAEYLLPANFVLSGSLSSDKIEDVPTDFRASFNTPDLRSVLSISNSGFGFNRNLGANITWRWQKGFLYESDFVVGELPAYHTVDLAVSYKVPTIKSMFKFGANNFLNQYYRNAVGNPSIGGLYYVSFAYNVL
ncbi:MAG: TonB-dependent receptor [Chitinophagaceae bacterium]|nr:MAG: TonB-dependent receptor [Chitinophagaceae bacterium]